MTWDKLVIEFAEVHLQDIWIVRGFLAVVELPAVQDLDERGLLQTWYTAFGRKRRSESGSG